MNDSQKGLTSCERLDPAIMSRAEPSLGSCLSSTSPPECSAAPARARDRDRSRRPARPGRPAATVLVAGLLLLGAAAAEAQTVRILVSNSGQTADDSANTSGNDHAQLFQTGANAAGYTFISMFVNSEDAEDDDFDVEICEADTTANEFPTSTCTALTAPDSFTAGNLLFTHTGLALSANTNYVVVVKQRGTGSVELNTTTSGGEDTSLGLSDWSIKDKFYWKSGSTWMLKSGSDEALRIIVRGYANTVADATDATLSALSVSGATLSPAFAAATTTYHAVVANSVSQGTITETTSEATATVEYLDSSDATLTDADTMTAGLQVNLSVGTNIVKVKVTAPDTTTTETYTVNVLRVAVPVACSPASMVNRIWTGNLTVGTQQGATAVGYGGSFGSLDNTTFSYNSNAYSIDVLNVDGTFGIFVFSLGTATLGTDANDLILHVGTEPFALADADSYTSSTNSYSFHTNAPTWADGDAACLALTVDGPAVSSVALTSTPGSDNTYAINDAVAATVTFDAAVDITGSPQLELDFDGTAKAATCATATNTTTMACSYTVLAGDTAPNGVAIEANKLTGGTIYATGSTTISADLDHTAVAIAAGHKVDGIRPTLVTTGSDAPKTSTDGTQVILTFSEDIGAVSLSDIDVTANATSGYEQGATVSRSGRTVTLTLLSPSLTIAAGWAVTVELSADAVDDAASNGNLALAATTVTNAVGSTTAPTVSGVALTSAPGSDNTYAIGDAVEATVTFDAAVDITGSPQLELDFNGTAKAAACATGTNTTTMACSYTVLVGDSAPNGVAIAANKLTGGTIYATGSTTTNADLDHVAVAIAAGHKVDGIRPTLLTTGSDAPRTSTDGTQVILTFSEDVSSPNRNNITISVTTGGMTASVSTTGASTTGTRVELTLMTALTTTATTITVALAAETVFDDASNGNLPVAATPVTNAVGTTGNSAPTFANPTETRSVAENSAAGTNVGAPVTASDTDSGDTLTYTLEGTDASSFSIVSTSGQIRTRSGVTYDYETTPSYTVIVKADDDNGGTDTVVVTITLTDVVEPPGPPTSLSVIRTSLTQVDLSWIAPTNLGDGGPITSYRIERSEQSGGPWTELVDGLSGTSYSDTVDPEAATPHYRVFAINGSGTSAPFELGPSRTGTACRPEPPKLALWTDRPGYRSGDTVRLHRSVDPVKDCGERRYSLLTYLEKPASGERRYVAAGTGSDQLHERVVDDRGRPEGSFRDQLLQPVEAALIWEGSAPDPGLWHFVAELRQGTSLSAEPKRAFAKFLVAERSQLLNRRGFDREVREDLTLRGDTIYYLLHQLFVHEGATLTIEAGALVHAWGPNAAIIVERGGRIVAEGSREAPVVLTCTRPTGQRQPGCWGGVRILGRAPVTRLEGTAAGVLPASRPVYGGSDPHDSSGTLRYVRVEFAGAGTEPEPAAPALGLYGAGDGTVLEHVQAHASLSEGIAFSGGTAACDFCAISGSGEAGLAWERGWRGAARHLFVQHGPGGTDGIRGANDPEGHDFEPRSLPALSNATLVHSNPYGESARRAVGLRLETGSGVAAANLLVTRFGGGAILASSRSALLFGEAESMVTDAILHRNGYRSGSGQLRGGIPSGVDFGDHDPKLRNVRWEANPDPRPEAGSPALLESMPSSESSDGGETAPGEQYIGAFGEENWLEEWTFFGPESGYDTR